MPGHKLSHTLFKIAKLSTEKEEVEEQLADTLEVMELFNNNYCIFILCFSGQECNITCHFYGNGLGLMPMFFTCTNSPDVLRLVVLKNLAFLLYFRP